MENTARASQPPGEPDPSAPCCVSVTWSASPLIALCKPLLQTCYLGMRLFFCLITPHHTRQLLPQRFALSGDRQLRSRPPPSALHR